MRTSNLSVAEALDASRAVEVAGVAVVVSSIVCCEYARSVSARGLLSVYLTL